MKRIFTKNNLLSATAILIYLAVIKFAIHVITGWQYGYFRDELYYFSMSEHPDFGYVDISPIVPFLLTISRFLFGSSVAAIHILPAIAGALTVFTAGKIAKVLGGGKFAQILTAVAVMAAPQFMIFNAMFTYDCFDQLMSVIFIYVVARLLIGDVSNNEGGNLKENAIQKGGSNRLWLVFGIVAGIGLMVKISMMFLGFSLFVALLLTPARKHFTKKWLWLGGLIALACCIPLILWQAFHGFPIIEYWQNYAQYKAFHASPIEFIKNQVLTLNPVGMVLVIAGVFFLAFSVKGKPFRVLFWTNLIYLILAIFMSFKFYILAASFVPLFAGGAIVLENGLAKRGFKWLKPTYASLLAVVGILLLPMSIPVLSAEDYIKYYMGSFGADTVKAENIVVAELPQHFADRFGWEDLAMKTAEVYNKLPQNERDDCAIFGQNYGDAGAIDMYGEKYGLPKAISGHLSYYVWGPRNYSGKYMIFLGYGDDFKVELEKYFDQVEVAAVFSAKYAIPEENNKPIYLCKNNRVPLKDVWPLLKNLS